MDTGHLETRTPSTVGAVEGDVHEDIAGRLFDETEDIAATESSQLSSDDSSGVFDWADVTSCINPQMETAVFKNSLNQLVVRQQAWPDDDPFIVVSLEYVPVLVRALMRAAGLTEIELPTSPQASDRSGARDPTARARQERYRQRKRDAGRDGNGG